jgi:hypothetical protein
MAHLSRRPSLRTPLPLLSALVISALACGGKGPPAGDVPGPGNQPMKPGQTEFTTDEAGGASQGKGGRGEGVATGAAPNANAAIPPASPVSDASAPGGRVADVEEGDIYRVDKNRLFYLNTYRGFLIYDVNDPKKPERVARLPVFGYPIEMYVAGNTVYALLRDALYLTQVGGKPQFERHNVSQLVSIDITDLHNPRVLKTIDIRGNLREGVSRKVADTIYVVSYVPQSYSWGWRPDPTQQKEQASVYSFNVANPQDLQKVGEYKVFEGGSVNEHDDKGNYYDRSFSEVYISATANALMVAENWNTSASSSGQGGQGGNGGYGWCGSYSSTQRVHVSLIDISDPTGVIKPHVDFWTAGRITDQFKMTYVFDAAAKTGTFFGILGRQEWSAANCQGTSYMKNTLESWDVSTAGKPLRLDTLDFGKTRETVRGSAFDTDRKVAYAITAQQIDPLYALDISNPRDLRVLSEINGLSGDMTVFRLVGDKQFLLGVGRDTSDACTGFQDTTQGWRSAKVAVSLIDVKDLSKIRLVQRQCVAVKNADWIGSDVNNDMDQAHKMLGMHADGSLNVLTIPVYYSKKVENQTDWWWYSWETAVGLMSWDLTRYDTALTPDKQTVIQNHGSFVHPHGEVRRSIVFTHESAAGNRRMMINLSDTHVSVADVQDLANPTLQSVIEVAPYYNQIYRFGDYLVEQVQSKPQSWGSPAQDVMTFRVKKAGGDLEDAVTIKSFDIGQIFRVLKHKDSLVLFRQTPDPRANGKGGVYYPPMTEALVLDMRNPAEPRLAGKTKVPTAALPYYRYWCGVDAYWGGFWFDQDTTFAMVDRGLVFYAAEWVVDDGMTGQGHNVNKLVFLDVRNPDAPTASESILPATDEWGSFGLVADPVDSKGFFITRRVKVGDVKTADGGSFAQYRYFAQRWEPEGDTWKAVHDINTPGRLIRTWSSPGSNPAGSPAGTRMFLAQDTTYRTGMEGMNKVWFVDQRLSLLRQVAVAGKPAAELLDVRKLTDLYPSALLVEGDKLLMNARPQKNYFYGFGYPGGVATGGAATGVATPATSVSVAGLVTPAPPPLPSWESTSDRLMIMDTSANQLAITYDQPTRMFNVQLMGTHQGKLYVNLMGGGNYSYYDRGAVSGGDGILVIDISNPAAPVGVRFLRTLGFASHIEFFGDDVYVAAGHFGLFHMNLTDPPSLPEEPQM